MVSIRSITDEEADNSDYEDGEWSAQCRECECELAIRPPERIFKLNPIDIQDAGTEWIENRWFTCKKCQKEFGYDAVESTV